MCDESCDVWVAAVHGIGAKKYGGIWNSSHHMLSNRSTAGNRRIVHRR